MYTFLPERTKKNFQLRCWSISFYSYDCIFDYFALILGTTLFENYDLLMVGQKIKKMHKILGKSNKNRVKMGNFSKKKSEQKSGNTTKTKTNANTKNTEKTQLSQPSHPLSKDPNSLFELLLSQSAAALLHLLWGFLKFPPAGGGHNQCSPHPMPGRW